MIDLLSITSTVKVFQEMLVDFSHMGSTHILVIVIIYNQKFIRESRELLWTIYFLMEESYYAIAYVKFLKGKVSSG